MNAHWVTRSFVIAALSLAASPVLADEIVCTAEVLYKPFSNPMTVIAARGAWEGMARVTRVDTETGVYTHHAKSTPDVVLASGTLTIIEPGSVEGFKNFVGVDVATGLYLQIALGSKVLAFSRVEPNGDVQVGSCTAGATGG